MPSDGAAPPLGYTARMRSTPPARIDEQALWKAVRLGEDSHLELKEARFKSARLVAPRPDDLADELAAFGNASGGRLVLGVADDRTPQALTPEELDRLIAAVGNICADRIKPPLEYEAHRVATPDGEGGVLVVDLPPGPTVHRSPGGHYRRRGHAKRPMQADDVRRLLLARGQSDATAVDAQPVAGTGPNSLQPKLWRRYASSRTSEAAAIQLAKLKFVKADAAGATRATIGGLLLAAEEPREWLPDAYIQAVRYDGASMDGNRQLDAQDIAGPLDAQIRGAMRFVLRNRRVAACKDPARREVPEYSERAVFEAVVNAVVHRDYAATGSHIRLFMFEDRLELCSPGGLGNSMAVEDLRSSQFTRNQLLASRLGQCPVEDAAGAGERRYFIERRGEGIGVIEDETFALAGRKPAFELVGERELKLTLPAASPPLPEGIAMRVEVADAATGEPLPGVSVLALYPNKTYLEAETDGFGHADFLLHSRVAITVFCAAPGRSAAVVRDQQPNGSLSIGLAPAADGGSLIVANGTGHLPGVRGRLNPILDNLDRMYLYADNVAVNDGMAQPVHFALDEPLRLTDALGASATVRFRELLGASCVLDYRLDAP